MGKPVIELRKSAWYVTDADGSIYSQDGRSWFSKDIARGHAIELGGMYHQDSRNTVKEVVTGYRSEA